MTTVLILFALASLLPAAEPANLPQAIEAHIRDLAGKSYDARKRAARALLGIGEPARAALERAARADDPTLRNAAREVLNDIRLGIGPGWPPELAQLARDYERLDPAGRSQAIHQLTDDLKEKAAPFLARRVAEEGETGPLALNCLRSLGTPGAFGPLLAVLKEAKTPFLAKASAWAHAGTGSPREALEILSRVGTDQATRREMAEAGVVGMCQQLKDRKFREAAKLAPEFIRAAPDDARFLYLLAEALIALDEEEEAEGLRKRALAMHPDQEGPHYVAGELLGKLGRRRLAALEWEAILAIPPANEVYDINAHLRLGAIYAACGQYENAANCFEKAHLLFAEARKTGHGMGMIGGSEEELQQKVAGLRRRAAQHPAPPDAPIEDELGDDATRLELTAEVKDGKMEELRRELGKVEATLAINIQPRDLRLFDVTGATLRYDPKEKKVGVVLNTQRFSDPVPFAMKASPARLAITTLDCYYIFEIDAATGEARKVARYEKDYTLRLVPGLRIAGCTKVTATINRKAYDWEELLKGVPFDYLPEVFEVVLEGTTAAGRRVTARVKVTPEEPEIQPIREGRGKP